MGLVRVGVAGLVIAVAAAGVTQAATLKVDYRLSLAGLTLGQADLAATFAGERYDLAMKAQMTGIAGLFTSSGRGGATATGALAGSRPVSSGFSATARTSSAERTVRMAVASGNAGAVDIQPPFELRPDRVPVGEGDKRGIIDPLSGVLGVVPARGKPDDPANCNRTVPVFDGSQRFNVVLSYADTKPFGKPGFPANVLVCNARYVPISGHRPLRWAVKYMTDNKEISVWLAPVEGTRALVPVRIAIMTYLGMSVVEAEKWTLTRDRDEGVPTR